MGAFLGLSGEFLHSTLISGGGLAVEER